MRARSERFICAVRTLERMISFRRWTEAKYIVNTEIKWLRDPLPPGIDGGWQTVARVLDTKGESE